MNRIHRLVFNRHRGVAQAVPETACGHGAAHGSSVASWACVLVWALMWPVAMPAGAAGGDGGNRGGSVVPPALGGGDGFSDGATGEAAIGGGIDGGGGGGGGAGIRLDGVVGSPGAGGIGFPNGGAGGAAGGIGALLLAPVGPTPAQLSIGIDGAAGDAAAAEQGVPRGGGGGGGGQGGVRLLMRTPGALSLALPSISGGRGGAGGAGGSGANIAGNGGNGGDGGSAVQAQVNGGPVSLTLGDNARLQAGDGGVGGRGGDASASNGIFVEGGSGGRGGRGGVALSLTNATVVNASGSIEGGQGGAGGARGTAPAGAVLHANGAAGAGGEAILGGSLALTNGGLIRGGLSGDGSSRADAIVFASGLNTLSLLPGSHIVGNVTLRQGTALTLSPAASGAVLDAPLRVDGAATVDTLDRSFDISGPVTGTGPIDKIGSGTLRLGGPGVDNSAFTGGFLLRQGRVDLLSSNALGTGRVVLDDNTTIGFAVDGVRLPNEIFLSGLADPVFDTGPNTATLTGNLSGAATFTKTGTGTLVMAGQNSLNGPTQLLQGTLRAGGVNTFSNASVTTVAAGATLDLAGFNHTLARVNNAGTVSLVGPAPGTVLDMQGDWVGQGGVLRLSTVLAGSASATDRLQMNDAAASGRTTVQVVNAGGLGALTLGNGIEVINAINGGTTTAQTTRDAFALQGGHVDAGAFEYRLFPADLAGAGESWYLRSSVIVPVVVPALPVLPVLPGLPVAQPAGEGVVLRQVPALRAEVPLFAALPQQLRLGDLAMMDNLHLRVGDENPLDVAELADGRARRSWGRLIDMQVDSRQSGPAQAHSRGRFEGFQVGTDLWTGRDWRGGLFVGQLDGDMWVDGFTGGWTQAAGRSDLRSRYLGGYLTWFGDDGWYVDGVLQAGFHRYELKPLGNWPVHGDGRSLLASVEAGKSFALDEDWKLEPQLQLATQRLHLDPRLIDGALVAQDASNSWMLRAGLRLKGEMTTEAGLMQPYARVNLYRNGGGRDTARFVTAAAVTPIASGTRGQALEAAGGFTLAVNDSTSIYGELGRLWGTGSGARSSSALRGSIGLRVKW